MTIQYTRYGLLGLCAMLAALALSGTSRASAASLCGAAAARAANTSTSGTNSGSTVTIDCLTINKGETTTIIATGYAEGSVVTITSDNAEIAKLDTGSASQTGKGPFNFTLRGAAGGLTSIHVTDSAAPSRNATVQVRVILPRFVLAGGIGYSAIPVSTFSIRQAPSDITPTPVPVPNATPPPLVSRIGVDEQSTSQTPIVLLGHVRLTDNSSTTHLVGLNLYGTLGVGTNNAGVIVGATVGIQDNFFLTVGIHSVPVTTLSQGFSLNQIVPAGTGSITTSSRQQRVFFSLTTSAQNIACIFSVKLTTACTSGT